jgi:hypothetical protein
MQWCKPGVEVERNRRENVRVQFARKRAVLNLLRVVQKGPCRQLLHTMSTMRKGRKSPFWPRYACSIARLVAAWRAPYVSLAQGPSFCKCHIVSHPCPSCSHEFSVVVCVCVSGCMYVCLPRHRSVSAFVSRLEMVGVHWPRANARCSVVRACAHPKHRRA